jgi:hypothetical protein
VTAYSAGRDRAAPQQRRPTLLEDDRITQHITPQSRAGTQDDGIVDADVQVVERVTARLR